jgi:hypothetical protein
VGNQDLFALQAILEQSRLSRRLSVNGVQKFTLQMKIPSAEKRCEELTLNPHQNEFLQNDEEFLQRLE